MAGKRPNILWICTDQPALGHHRRSGQPRLKTPNLDHLVTEGTEKNGRSLLDVSSRAGVRV